MVILDNGNAVSRFAARQWGATFEDQSGSLEPAAIAIDSLHLAVAAAGSLPSRPMLEIPPAGLRRRSAARWPATEAAAAWSRIAPRRPAASSRGHKLQSRPSNLDLDPEPSLTLRPERKWPGPDLNRRHLDFQSSALPTELPSRSALKGGRRPGRADPPSRGILPAHGRWEHAPSARREDRRPEEGTNGAHPTGPRGGGVGPRTDAPLGGVATGRFACLPAPQGKGGPGSPWQGWGPSASAPSARGCGGPSSGPCRRSPRPASSASRPCRSDRRSGRSPCGDGPPWSRAVRS